MELKTEYPAAGLDSFRSIHQNCDGRVQKANSAIRRAHGHGRWRTRSGQFLRHSPTNPNWQPRPLVLSAVTPACWTTRFSISPLRLTIEDLQSFRQWDSKTPPSRAWHDRRHRGDHRTARTGIRKRRRDAIAQRRLAYEFNSRHTLIATTCIRSARRRPPGRHQRRSRISCRASALGKLVVLYDDNQSSSTGHQHGLTEERAGPLRRIPVAYAAGRRRQRRRRISARSRPPERTNGRA